MIDQITVFLANDKGRLSSLCAAMADAGINMHTLTVADTSDYGLVRIISDRPVSAVKALTDAGYSANLTKVSAIKLPNRPGALAQMLRVLDGQDVNIEYGYCFAYKDDEAIDVLKIRNAENAVDALVKAGFEVLQPADLYEVD
jgi:hypothetical protein